MDDVDVVQCPFNSKIIQDFFLGGGKIIYIQSSDNKLYLLLNVESRK